MKNIIKKVLKEQITDKVITKVLSQLNQGKIKPPYFRNLELIGLTEDEIKTVLQMFTNGGVFGYKIHNKRNNVIYLENLNGSWSKWGYDKDGNNTYYEDSNGYWEKTEYDENGVIIYHEDSDDGIILDER